MIPPKQNAAFVAAMEDVLDVYQRPYDSKRPVVNKCDPQCQGRLYHNVSAFANREPAEGELPFGPRREYATVRTWR